MLFTKQLSHTKRVIEFFKSRLFLIIKRSGSTQIDIHPNILRGGIVELEKISTEARKILVDYYATCESVYRKGVEEVLRSKYTPFSSDKTKR
jgi:hypothetical protein